MIHDGDDDGPPPLEHVGREKISSTSKNDVKYGGVLEVKERNNALMGMKRGFLNVSKDTNESTKKSRESSILVLDEVQEAMKIASQKISESQNVWLNDQLLARLESDSVVKPFLQDSAFLEAFGTCLDDPKKLAFMAQSKPEWQIPIQRIFGILGEHYEELGRQQEIQTLPKNEQDLVNKVLDDTQIQDILKDPEILNFLNLLRSNPERGHAFFMSQSKNLDFQRKVGKLAEIGLLQLQQ